MKEDGDNSGGMNCQIVLGRLTAFSAALFVKAKLDVVALLVNHGAEVT